ncbi:hypothetical protein LTR10_023020 [Elasticomyces elasticus]|uniref:Uncharacterized protein n=1 Tax=Exophiala sideris TaxID=1016849 RepID=A0ABR0J6J3_9EURO|nr:hypothetical protein LTR10_023020 [Elasticomyces elasticus]KAK5028921.1 hypothetical protein LTS07_006302 [Exophiala sideris]KAK5035790.1 hypothetical protein LTR13_005921 [Exophiala sideris]KAK5057425.1 hypothetical protein LTR69_007466 [Exophiala sideris]KAK5181599.1 hypothetical protein LTR44_005798 [Eurotiomycetes sp. CCFEE 6388]
MSSRRGRARAGRTNPDFLWVNRTPESDSLSATRQERDELRTITSHARQWRASLRRQQRLYSAQTEAVHAQSVVGWAQQHSISETSSAETSGGPSPSPLAQPTGNTTEPFTYLETPEDALWSHEAYQYAVGSWLPSVFRGLDALDETVATSPTSFDTINRIVQGCLSNRMHMFSLLATSSGYAKYVSRLQLVRHDCPEYCMSKALRHLRHQLSSNPEASEMLIFDLGALSVFERYVGNFEGARTHFTMVHHLIQTMGGIDNLEPPMQLLCCLWDLLISGGTGEPPLMPLIWDPGLFSQDEMRGQVLPTLHNSGVPPSGAALLQYTSQVRPELQDTVVDMVQWFQVQQYNNINNFADLSTERWATQRSYALMHRLLSTSLDTSHHETSGQPLLRLLSECMKQAFLLIISNMVSARVSRVRNDSHKNPSCVPWSNTARFQQSLMTLIESGEDWQHDHEDIVLWMVCLGGQQALPNGDRAWFLGFARDIAQGRGFTTLDELTQLMSKYLHLCEPTGAPDITGIENILVEES